MSKPSFSNIDLWLFELAEGNLTQEQIAQLELFILQHPELDIDRDMWEMAKVESVPVSYPDQGKLEKRRPIALYAAFGASAIVLFSLIGWYAFDGTGSEQIADSGQIVSGEAVALQKSKETEEQLRSEIHDLKAIIAAMESERGENRVATVVAEQNTDLATEELPGRPLETVSDNSNVVAVVLNNSEVANRIESNEAQVLIQNDNGNSIAETNTIVNNDVRVSDEVIAESVSGETIETNEELAESVYEEELEPIAAEEMQVDVASYEPTLIRNDEERSHQTFSSGYQSSLKNRLAHFGRTVQRMMDNPVALKNSRDPHFHVPGMLPQDVNFGATGTLISPRVQTLSRMQWYEAENENFMNEVAVDGYSYAMRGGIGVQLSHNFYNRGGIQVSNVAVTYSPKISISRTISVEPAVRFKMGNKLLNHEIMSDQSQVEVDRGNVHDFYMDGQEPIGRSLWYKDLGLGLNVNTKWFFVSAQVDNMFRYKDNIYTQDQTNPRRAGTQFVATMGTDLDSKNEKFRFSPYFVVNHNEQLTEGWVGANFRWNWISVGGAISTNMDPAGSVGMNFKHFSMHYNADYAYSMMTGERSLSHQVTLRILGKQNRFGRRLLNL